MTSSLSLPLVGYLQNQDSALQKSGAYSDSEQVSQLLERRLVVCRVVLENGQGGTGFLIGKDLIMTNNHVITDIEAARKAKAIFFYTTGNTGIEVNLVVRELRAASFDLDYTIHSGRRESDAVVATAETLLVPYDREAARPRRLTDAERDFLAGYRAGVRSA